MGGGLRFEEEKCKAGPHRTRLWQRGIHQVMRSYLRSIYSNKDCAPRVRNVSLPKKV